MAKAYSIAEHTLGAGQTIYGLIKFYNDNNMTKEELEMAQLFYLIENNEGVRRAGETVNVPILPKYKRN
jgi:hypothetical protein